MNTVSTIVILPISLLIISLVMSVLMGTSLLALSAVNARILVMDAITVVLMGCSATNASIIHSCMM